MIILEEYEALIRKGKIGVPEVTNLIIENSLEGTLPVVEDFCKVTSSGRSQNVSYDDFVSSGEIIDWSYERRNFYKKAKENEDGELEVRINHSSFIRWNGNNFELVVLYDLLNEMDL